jgi:hypothetical protein
VVKHAAQGPPLAADGVEHAVRTPRRVAVAVGSRVFLPLGAARYTAVTAVTAGYGNGTQQ